MKTLQLCCLVSDRRRPPSVFLYLCLASSVSLPSMPSARPVSPPGLLACIFLIESPVNTMGFTRRLIRRGCLMRFDWQVINSSKPVESFCPRRNSYTNDTIKGSSQRILERRSRQSFQRKVQPPHFTSLSSDQSSQHLLSVLSVHQTS